MLHIQGTGCEMYTEMLSTSFIGMSFTQAAEACFVKVRLNGYFMGIKTDAYS